MNKGINHGKMATVVCSTDSFEIRANTKSTMPRGGCSNPIMRFNTMTKPKWIGSMPSFKTIGNKMGTRIVIAAVVSMKHPTRRISKFAKNKKTHLFCVKPRTQSASICAAWLVVNNQAKIDAAVTMNNTLDVVSIVSKVALASPLIVIDR